MTSWTIADPELDQTATYAVDPARARQLARRVVASPNAQTFTRHSPMTGAPLAELPLSTPADVTVAVEQARAAQKAWARTDIRVRQEILLRLHDLVLDAQVELLDLVQLEAGKARWHAFEEVLDVALCSRHYGRSSAGYLAPQRRAGALPVITQTVESRRPKGVVGVVSPWNYPLSLAITDALPALMAGNAVVLRPDMQGSLCALAGLELLDRAGLPDGVLQVVLGEGSDVGQAVVDQTDYVCYTGSTPTGRRVAESVAKRLVGYSLELGGKNSLYVAEDADLAKTVDGAVRCSFASAGQLCISAERIIVHEKVAEEFTARFVAAVDALKVGTELAFGTDVGSLVSQTQLDRVTAHVEDARAKGARVLSGGRHRPDLGPFVFEPTVLEGVTPDMACRNEETFGPVVSIYRVGSDEEAIALANDTEYGLNASVWTRSVSRGRDIASRIRTGTVNINEAYGATWASMGAPMGGMKNSGIGRRHGAEGILKYTEAQTVSAQYLMPVIPTLGLAPDKAAKALTTGLRVLKALGAK
ncbi:MULTISPECIES: succinic semialdehyde dehydrogenase [unclassified Janibacter]|uniref:succinic semialdehyde dehydrogenase n=1 Tax=unclassified Janibacter TaxID=2649294 RepID=UPI003D029287